ncbi:MAG TPA: response regulator [Planctomycetaceae bacterium]|nr:response regulator [Planctomycetaceae bacterium]
MAALREGAPVDLVVIDAMIPVSPEDAASIGATNPAEVGCALARQLADERPHIPVILLSNRDAAALQAMGQPDNVRRILWKAETTPYDVVDALREVLNVCASADLNDKTTDRGDWRSLIRGRKVVAFEKFLSTPEELTQADVLLLSEINQGLMQRLLSAVPAAAPTATPWSNLTTAQLARAVPHQSTSAQKGECLEELMLRLFNSCPGFEAKTRVRTKTEEIDLFILNGSNVAPWRDMGPVLLAECKNWSSKCGVPEYTHFESKVRSRYGQCKCGFFISWNGFAETFTEQRLRASREGLLIIEIEGTDAEEGAIRGSFDTVLRRLWEGSVAT